MEQHRVLPEPPEAGPVGQLTLQQRSGIDVDTCLDHSSGPALQPAVQLLHPAPEHRMVVFPACVAGDHGSTPVVRNLGVGIGIVALRDDDRAPEGGERLPQVRAPLQRVRAREVPHLAVPSRSDPAAQEVRMSAHGIDHDAGSVETDLPGAAEELVRQSGGVAVEIHARR